jgi:hypothetical protein
MKKEKYMRRRRRQIKETKLKRKNKGETEKKQ